MRTMLHKVVLLAAAFCLTLAACGQPTTPSNSAAEATSAPEAAPTTVPAPEGAPTAAATSAPATSSEPVDIELWAGASVSEAGPPPEDWVAYTQMREDLAINLNLVLLPSDFADQDVKINAAAAANALPDLFQVNRDTWYRLVQNGLIAPVDDLLPQMPERTKTHYNDADRIKLATVDGKMYGLPEPGALPHTDGLVIRQDWLDKLGLEAPTTLEEFLAVAKAFTEQDPDGNGQNDTYGFGAFIETPGLYSIGLGPRFDFIYGAHGVAGLWNLSDAEAFGLNVRNPQYRQATEFVKRLVDEHVIDPDWPTLKKDEFRARWKQGRYGIMIENFAALSTVANYKDFDTNFPDGEWAVLAPPTGPDGDSSEGVTVKGTRMYAVSQRAVDAGKGPAIARLLEWMATDGYYLLGFGQQDVNYKLDANGYVTTEGIDPALSWTAKEQQPLTQLRNLVFINSDIELKARYVTYETQNGRTMDPLSYWNGFSDQPWTEATGAAIINPPSNGADFTRFYSENLVTFVLGQQPLDDASWQQFVDGLDGLGAKDLEASAKETLVQADFLE